MTRKYQKFGLRADRNLADLADPRTALANLLDNISVVDQKFLPEDLLIIDGLRNTSISPDDFTQLEGAVETYTRISDNTELVVTPLVTIQDTIRNFQTVFGNPPFIGGGDGFLANFVPSERVNPSPTKTITGNNSATEIAGRDDLIGSNTLFSTFVPDRITQGSHPFTGKNIIGPQYYWDRGVFTFDSKLHPTFPDSYGLIQWTGYMSSDFRFRFDTSGLLIIEEDTLDDGNWITKKSIYDQTRSFTGVTVATPHDGTQTILQYNSDVIHVGVNDVVTIDSDSTEYVVTEVDNVTGLVTVEGDAITGGTTFNHYFEVGSDEISTGLIYVTRPKLGQRTKIRFTWWIPRPVDIGESATKTYRSKSFIESERNDDRFPFTDVYSENTGNQSFSVYSYKEFEDTRAKPQNQSMSEEFSSGGVLFLDYDPPFAFSEVSYGSALVTHKGYGRLEATASISNSISEGDWMVLTRPASPAVPPFAYQIDTLFTDENNVDIIYPVTDDISPTPDGLAIDEQFNIVFFRNLGLIGLYNFTGNAADNSGFITEMTNAQPININVGGAVNGSYPFVQPDYLIATVLTDNTSQQSIRHITQVDNQIAFNRLEIQTNDTFGTGASILSDTRIAAVYSNTGLKDLSTVVTCEGVFGKETLEVVNGNDTLVKVTDSTNIELGDYVQFGNAIPSGASVQVGSITATTVTATGEPAIALGLVTDYGLGTQATYTVPSDQGIPSNVTLIIVKNAFNPSGVSKEFCVIPLNTAPPFTSIPTGLSTTTANPNLTTARLAFDELEIVDKTNSSAIAGLNGATVATNVVPLTYRNSSGQITIYNLLVE